jgi:hypothetical protein
MNYRGDLFNDLHRNHFHPNQELVVVKTVIGSKTTDVPGRLANTKTCIRVSIRLETSLKNVYLTTTLEVS